MNMEKSDLPPARTFSHLGMLFETHIIRIRVSYKRANKLKDLTVKLLGQESSSPRELASLIGMAQSAAELILLGKATLRPLQWLLADEWSPSHRTGTAPSISQQLFTTPCGSGQI